MTKQTSTNTNARLYILCGLAFSGKSTLGKAIAEYCGGEYISFDELWVEQDEVSPVPKNSEGWLYIRQLAMEKARQLLAQGSTVIYDENNPKREHRREFEAVAENVGAGSLVVYLNTSIELVRKRELENSITQTRHAVEPINFEKVLKDFEAPEDDENHVVYNPDTNLETFLSSL